VNHILCLPHYTHLLRGWAVAAANTPCIGCMAFTAPLSLLLPLCVKRHWPPQLLLNTHLLLFCYSLSAALRDLPLCLRCHTLPRATFSAASFCCSALHFSITLNSGLDLNHHLPSPCLPSGTSLKQHCGRTFWDFVHCVHTHWHFWGSCWALPARVPPPLGLQALHGTTAAPPPHRPPVSVNTCSCPMDSALTTLLGQHFERTDTGGQDKPGHYPHQHTLWATWFAGRAGWI